MTIRPHNALNPVPLDAPCYRCDAQWKIMRLDADDRERLEHRLVVKCRGCGVVSFATRPAATEPSSVAPLQ